MSQIFVSHSKEDKEIRLFFGDIFGKTRVEAQFVEYEKYQPPAWNYIQQEINKSVALFVLLGPNVEQLAHTQVWIGSETGAVPSGKEVWVFEHLEQICNVPIPNMHHYMLYNYDTPFHDYIRSIIESYDDSPTIPSMLVGGAGGAALGGTPGAIAGALLLAGLTSPARNRPVGVAIECQACKHVFRLHTKTDALPCPVCRRWMNANWS
jgi:hypothetical protein